DEGRIEVGVEVDMSRHLAAANVADGESRQVRAFANQHRTPLPTTEIVRENEVSGSRAQTRGPGPHLITVRFSRAAFPLVTDLGTRLRAAGAKQQSKRTGHLETERIVQPTRARIVFAREENELGEAVIALRVAHQ